MDIVIASESKTVRQALVRQLIPAEEITVQALLKEPAALWDYCQRYCVDGVLLHATSVTDGFLQTVVQIAQQPGAPAVVFVAAEQDSLMSLYRQLALPFLHHPVLGADIVSRLRLARPMSDAQIERLEKQTQDGVSRAHLLCRRRTGLGLIPVSAVRCLVADHKYVTVEHEGGEDLIEDSLVQLEAEFGGRFLRVHRGALVARDALCGIEKDLDGRAHALVAGTDQRLPISRRQLPQVRRWLKGVASAP